jgi:hypothetical protein
LHSGNPEYPERFLKWYDIHPVNGCVRIHMGRKCGICSHPQAREINRAILAGDTIRMVTESFGVNRSAVSAHRINHLRQSPRIPVPPRRANVPSHAKALSQETIDQLQDDVALSSLHAEDIDQEWIVRKQAGVLEKLETLCGQFEGDSDRRGLLDGLKACTAQIKELGASSGAISAAAPVQVDISISAEGILRQLDLTDAPSDVRQYLAGKMWGGVVLEHEAVQDV